MVAVPQEARNLRLLTPVRVVSREEAPAAAAFSRFQLATTQSSTPAGLLRLVCTAEHPQQRKDAARELLSVSGSGTSRVKNELGAALIGTFSGSFPREGISALVSEASSMKGETAMRALVPAAAELLASGDGKVAEYARRVIDMALPTVGDGGKQKLTTTLIGILGNPEAGKTARSAAVEVLAKIYRTADADASEDIVRAVANAEYEGCISPKALDAFRSAVRSARREADESGTFRIDGLPAARRDALEVA